MYSPVMIRVCRHAGTGGRSEGSEGSSGGAIGGVGMWRSAAGGGLELKANAGPRGGKARDLAGEDTSESYPSRVQAVNLEVDLSYYP